MYQFFYEPDLHQKEDEFINLLKQDDIELMNQFCIENPAYMIPVVDVAVFFGAVNIFKFYVQPSTEPNFPTRYLSGLCAIINELYLLAVTDRQTESDFPSYVLSKMYLLDNIDKYLDLVDYLYNLGANPVISRPCDESSEAEDSELSRSLGFGYSSETDTWVSIGEFCTCYLEHVEDPEVRLLMQRINGQMHQSNFALIR